MSKLSLDALKSRAEATASTELLATISGGTEDACHNKTAAPAAEPKVILYKKDDFIIFR